MTHPVWPLFDVRVRTPRLELRYVDDEMACELAVLATKGIHGPDMMPFTIPWSEVESPELERNTMQFYWRCRATLTPQEWHINLATIVDGAVVGTTGLMAKDFPVVRQFETGSWLGRAFQGAGIGKEMRAATLQLGFAGFGAHWATTAAWSDNGPSNGVTRRLGYQEQGRRRSSRKGVSNLMIGYEMSREFWHANVARDDIVVEGADACLALLGLEPEPCAD